MRRALWLGLLLSLSVLMTTTGCRKKEAPAPARPIAQQGNPAPAALPPKTPGAEANPRARPPSGSEPRTGQEGKPFLIPGAPDALTRPIICPKGLPERTARTIQALIEIQQADARQRKPSSTLPAQPTTSAPDPYLNIPTAGK